MVETEKTITAINEKNKWAQREEDILEEIESIRDEKKELSKRAKELKDLISRCEEAIKIKRKEDMSIHDTAADFLR